jgi:homoserine O-acetyltransferase
MSECYECIELPELELQSGKTLRPVRAACTINGIPKPDGSNVVVVCHALTGSHHVTGPAAAGLPEGWWDHVVGAGGALDPEKLCVVCCNNLCSPYGSSAPIDIEPGTERPWGMRFPMISPRDVARSQKIALEALGIQHVAGVIGGSLGGMTALEWMASFPEDMDFCVAVATPSRLYPQAIAFNGVQRRTIMTDSEWKDGDYFPGKGPVDGLYNARMLAMITYRSEESFVRRYMRESRNIGEWEGRFDVESYLMYHGEEITRRFDANCYLYLTKMMDLHDIGQGRGDTEAAFEPFRRKPFLSVGISSDILFPAWQAQELAESARDAGVRSVYRELRSDVGHDAFLVEMEQINAIFGEFFRDIGF